ncbi:MAG TPA: precorrin-2 C(20)-methyltransferase [Gammaproteobacteria bacterium]|nr:precorrin-2 C(20)-methyltransferase [Gammaproteobacteria bacterium]
MKVKGCLYGVSLGPGDPGLITRTAWDCLQQDAVWTYPKRNKKSESYAFDIAIRAGLELPAEHQPLIFPMTHDESKLAKHWLAAAQIVLEYLQQGKDVMFLVEGDASTYSTFGHLARTVQGLDEDIELNIVAGVPSFHAAAARVQTSLAEVDDTIAIIPAGYGLEMIENLLKDFDTLVLLKVKPLLDDIIDLLKQKNILQHATFIEKAGAPEERVVEDISNLQGGKVNYLSLLLIKNPDRSRGEMIRGCRKKVSKTEENLNE